MGKVILNTNIKRETGKLYYCGTDKATGNVTLCEAVMARGGRRKNSRNK